MLTITRSVIKNNNNKETFPKLMRGKEAGAIYLAHSIDSWAQEVEVTTLIPGKSSNMVGSRNRYAAFLLEDFHGSITLTS